MALLANDSDFVPALEFAKSRLGKRTVVISPNKSKKVHHLLRWDYLCDEALTVSAEILKESLFPNDIRLADGSVRSRPDGW